jgi:hypothetical protein
LAHNIYGIFQAEDFQGSLKKLVKNYLCFCNTKEIKAKNLQKKKSIKNNYYQIKY